MQGACGKRGETFEINCRNQEVILVNRASYGRMRKGECITSDLGLGCETDVLPLVEKWCSGRRGCNFIVPNPELNTANKCADDFVNYLEVDYSCMKGDNL